MSVSRQAPRMVRVRTVDSAFHARVIAARLGSEGIVCELRGNVGGPYPFGEASVWVPAGDADLAAELLLADEVEAAFDAVTGMHGPEAGRWLTRRRVIAGAGIVAMAVAALAAHVGL